MDRYAFSAHLSLFSLLAMIFALIAVDKFEIELVEGTRPFLAAQTFGIIGSVLFMGSGLFLWVTGFRRFGHIIKNLSLSWYCYFAFTVFSAIYMQYRYGNEIIHS